MRIYMITFGTRGDVQPYVALGAGLKASGHDVTLAAPTQFAAMITAHGLRHHPLRGDFVQAAQAAGGNTAASGRSNPLKLLREYIQMARETLEDEWVGAQSAEVVIYNLAALGGYHIAEKLGVPAFASFPAPLYTPTRVFPSPFFPFRSLGPFNKLSHRLFAALGPAMYRRPISQWRREVLGLPPAKGEDRLDGKPVIKLYAYSPTILPRPADWDAASVVTGYWFLKTPAGWQPETALVRFLQAGPPPVYVGFGSMFMGDGARQAQVAIQALQLAGQRGVLAAGYGGLRLDEVPDHVYFLESVPHDWLFPQMAAIVHHGGAGTTGAALLAGKPNVVCPFVGDQTFWGRRVAALGAGPPPIPRRQLTAERLAQAISTALADQGIRSRATDLGTAIRAEDGVGNAVALINRQLEVQQ